MHKRLMIGVAAAVLVLVTGSANAGEPLFQDGATLKADPWRPGTFELRDDHGRELGTIRKDPWRPGTFELHDDQGRSVGTIRKNPWSDTWEIRRD